MTFRVIVSVTILKLAPNFVFGGGVSGLPPYVFTPKWRFGAKRHFRVRAKPRVGIFGGFGRFSVWAALQVRILE